MKTSEAQQKTIRRQFFRLKERRDRAQTTADLCSAEAASQLKRGAYNQACQTAAKAHAFRDKAEALDETILLLVEIVGAYDEGLAEDLDNGFPRTYL